MTGKKVKRETKDDMKDKTKFLDSAIEKGIIFLLVFTPLAFGTVQQWAVSVMEMTAFSVLCLMLLKKDIATQKSPLLKPLLVLVASLTGLVLFQMLPLPEGILELVSPSSLRTYKRFGDYAEGAFHPISINPYSTGQDLLKLLSYAAVFFVIAGHYRTRRQIKSLVKTILFMGCLLAVFAIFQKMTWNGRIFWFYPVEEALQSGAGIWGPYINRNHFAGYMEMAIPLGLGLLIYRAPGVHAPAGVPAGRRIGRFLASENLLPFTLFFLFVLIMSASLFTTLSRGGILAFTASSLFFIWITGKRRSLRKKTGLFVLSGAVVVAVIMLASWERLEQRFEELEQERHIVRLRIWEDSLGIVKDYPVFGSGLGTFENVYMRYQTKDPAFLYDHAHNDYLELLTDTGIAGILIGAGMVIFLFRAIFNAWLAKRSMFGKCMGAGGLSSCVAVAVHSFTDFNLHIPANALLLTVICAVTYAAVFNESEIRSSSEDNVPLEKGGIKGGFTSYVLLSLACLLLLMSARDLVADHYYRRVAGILDDTATEELDIKPISESTMPDYLDAIRSLKTAAFLAPSRSAYQKALSDLYARLGRWADTMESLNARMPETAPSKSYSFENAVAYMRKAVSLEPANPDYHLGLGQLYETANGGSPRADAEFMKALEAFPANAPTWYAVAMHYLLTGRKAEALEQARLLARIDDSYIIPESPRKTYMIERRTTEYMTVLNNSYLFGAFEIAWRASKDPDVIKGIGPGHAGCSRGIAGVYGVEGD